MARMRITEVPRSAIAGAIAGATALMTGALMTAAASADQVFNDDVIITQSLCVGFDCVNGESFGFDTIRLKENNLRIHFQDTSNSASFPSRDWRLVANDTRNGGANYFAIEDTDAGTLPFLVEADAGSNALYVDDAGRVGFGTSSPVVELHVADGDSPTLRLEQNGSSGFTAQTWDLAGNETNFFIRDVTNGSLLPFKIRPSAPTNSLYINTNGDVGLQTASPTAPLHVRRTNGSSQVLIEEASGTSAARQMLSLVNNGRPRMHFVNTEATNPGPVWSLDGGPSFLIRDRTNNLLAVVISEATGNMRIAGELTTAGSTCGTGCDEVFEDDYPIMPISERAALMYELGYLPNVGPTIENEPFNVTQKVGRMLNELEHAHIYIAQLEARLTALEAASQQGG